MLDSAVAIVSIVLYYRIVFCSMLYAYHVCVGAGRRLYSFFFIIITIVMNDPAGPNEPLPLRQNEYTQQAHNAHR